MRNRISEKRRAVTGRKTAGRILCAVQAAVLLLLASCGAKPVRDSDADAWHAVTLREYDSVVRELCVLPDGIAAVYYDMGVEDYAYDLFSDDDRYLGTVRPAAFSGCPQARKIVPYDGGCLLLDREHGLWAIEGIGKDDCRAEKIASFDEDPADFLLLDGTICCAQSSTVRALSPDGKTKSEIDVGSRAERLFAVDGGLYVETWDEPSRSASVFLVAPGGRPAEVRLPNIRFISSQRLSTSLGLEVLNSYIRSLTFAWCARYSSVSVQR